jgi:hypothetical protein
MPFASIENAYYLIPIDRLKINTIRLLNKTKDWCVAQKKGERLDTKDFALQKQLKHASSMMNVLESRIKKMLETAEPDEKLALDNDLRDLKAKYGLVSAEISKLNVKNNNNNNNVENSNTKDQDIGVSERSGIEGNKSLSDDEEDDDEEDEDDFDSNAELLPNIKSVHNNSDKKRRVTNRLASVKFVAKSPIDTKQSDRKERRKMIEKNKNINALNELIKFRKELNLDSGEFNSASYDDSTAQEERDRQMEEILATAKALKEATLNSKNKVKNSNAIVEEFQKNMDKMIDKTDVLNKKTKDSLNVTWDVLKLQCSILIFSVVAVVVLFFVMRFLPKQF